MFGVEMGDFPPSDSRSVVSDSLDPMDWSPPGSSVHGILQARILEWVAISLSTQPLFPPKINLFFYNFFIIIFLTLQRVELNFSFASI